MSNNKGIQKSKVTSSALRPSPRPKTVRPSTNVVLNEQKATELLALAIPFTGKKESKADDLPTEILTMIFGSALPKSPWPGQLVDLQEWLREYGRGTKLYEAAKQAIAEHYEHTLYFRIVTHNHLAKEARRYFIMDEENPDMLRPLLMGTSNTLNFRSKLTCSVRKIRIYLTVDPYLGAIEDRWGDFAKHIKPFGRKGGRCTVTLIVRSTNPHCARAAARFFEYKIKSHGTETGKIIAVNYQITILKNGEDRSIYRHLPDLQMPWDDATTFYSQFL